MTNMPTRSKLVSGLTTEADFQEALGDFYDVVNQLGVLGPAESNELDASGNITPTKCNITMDTEGDAATDTLNLIVPTNVGEKMIFIRTESAARVITIKHLASGTGKIYLNTLADVVMKNPSYCIALMWDATAGQWKEMWRNFGVVIPSGDEAAARASLGLGTAATRNTGISSGQIPLYDNFGTAAFVNTGVSTGQVPLANQLGSLAFLSQVTDSQLNGSGVSPGTYDLVTVNAQGRVTGGSAGVSPFSNIKIRVFVSSATYVPTAGMKACIVECQAGYAGTTSFGGFMTAVAASGTTGGGASGGDFNVQGGSGFTVSVPTGDSHPETYGAPSHYGNGGHGGLCSPNAGPTGYGGGAAGQGAGGYCKRGFDAATIGAAQSMSIGSNGLIIVTEFI